METAILTETKGIPLIKIPEIVPRARILSRDNFGDEYGTYKQTYQEALKEYAGRARSSLDVIDFSDDIAKGSNIFALYVFNKILQKDKRTATLSDLGQIVEADENYLKGTFEDALEVVLRSPGDSYKPNDYLAEDLAKQIKKTKFKVPVIIKGLECQEDNNSDYGLVFKVTNETEIIDAPELSHKNHLRKYSKTNERGLPIFAENGTRTLYTREDGLSRLCLYRDLDLYSYYLDLSDSVSDGRVVIVSGEATSQNFKEDIIKKINESYEKKIAPIKEAKERALKLITDA